MNQDIRWLQRFANFDRAFILLREAFDRGLGALSQLEKEGTIQRFEVAYELAWKTMKDYLEYQGIIVDPATPRNAIKEAFAAALLPDGQVWIDMMLSRNLISHTYDIKVFERVLADIKARYLPALEALYEFFLEKRSDS
jgi:nucleotidyltransferase substrate binding protein (TIGR01987 family)